MDGRNTSVSTAAHSISVSATSRSECGVGGGAREGQLSGLGRDRSLLQL